MWGSPSVVPASGRACPITGSLRPTDGPSRPRLAHTPEGGAWLSVRASGWRWRKRGQTLRPGRCGRQGGAPGRALRTVFSHRAWGGYAHLARRAVRPDLACVRETGASQPVALEQEGACGSGPPWEPVIHLGVKQRRSGCQTPGVDLGLVLLP